MATGDLFPNSTYLYSKGFEIDCDCIYEQVQVIAGEGTADQEMIDTLNEILQELNEQTALLTGTTF